MVTAAALEQLWGTEALGGAQNPDATLGYLLANRVDGSSHRCGPSPELRRERWNAWPLLSRDALRPDPMAPVRSS